MKRILLLALAVICLTLPVFSQKSYMRVHKSDGNVLELMISEIDSVSFFITSDSPSASSHEYVDLGLSVLWATCNVGANSPEKYGDYYAWGEVETKESYYNGSYKFIEDAQLFTDGTYTKYYEDDGKRVLDPEDDVAYVKWGEDWRIPSVEEYEELIDNCIWTKDTLNGVIGYYAVSKINGNSIFFPAAGEKWYDNATPNDVGNVGIYHANRLYSWSSGSCFYFNFTYGDLRGAHGVRYSGKSVRPVCEKPNDPSIPDTIPDNEIWYTSTDGKVITPYSLDGMSVSIVSNKYDNGKGVIRFDGPVRGIGFAFMRGRENLESIVLPNCCTAIGGYSFFACTSLRIVTFPRSLINIGAMSFYYCELLEHVVFPGSLQLIGDGAFSRCTSISELEIPESVTKIDIFAFSDCKITRFHGKFAGENGLYLSDGVTLMAVAWIDTTSFTVPQGIKKINDGVFYGSVLSEIILPDGLISIGAQAFGDCDSLREVVIPESVTSIGNDAFRYCDNLATVKSLSAEPPVLNMSLFDGTACLIYVPAGSVDAYKTAKVWSYYADRILAISDGQSGGQQGSGQPNDEIWYTSKSGKAVDPFKVNELGSMIISNTYDDGKGVIKFSCDLSKVWDSTFYYCSDLTSISIPAGVSAVGNSSFSYCTNLSSVSLPDGIKTIGKSAFLHCSKLESVSFPESLEEIGNNAFFYGCEKLTSLHIPAGVTKIGYEAFFDCTVLSSITVDERNSVYDSRNNCNAIIETATNTLVLGSGNTIIPNGVTKIGVAAFFGCQSLHSIIIPEGVVSIEMDALSNTGITTIDFPSSLQSIGYRSFETCDKLSSVVFPENLVSIDSYAFSGCRSLTSIRIPKSVTRIGSAPFDFCSGLVSIEVEADNSYYDSRNNCNAIINSSTNELLAGCINTIIPSDVKSLGNNSFAECGIDSIKIPDSVEKIGDWVFCACENLSFVTIPENVKTIGSYAFLNCYKLSSINIPENVEKIGSYAFQRCYNLGSVYVYSTDPGSIQMGNYVFNYVKIDTCTLYVPEGCADAYRNVVPWNQFGKITTFKPDNQSGGQQGSGQPNDEIWYTSTDNQIVTLYDVNGFGATMVSNTYADGKGVMKFDSPVTSIGDMAFAGYSTLLSIAIPASVDTIGAYVFRGSSNLASIGVDPDNTAYDSRNDCNAIIESATNKLIAGCNNTVIPYGVTSIGDYALYGYGGLSSLDIPNSVTSIGMAAFFGCAGIKTVVIPEGVTSIGMAPFAGCSGLTSISVAAGNPKYDSRNGCNAIIETSTNMLLAGLDNTVIPADVTSIGPYAFYCCSFTTLDIPKGVTSIGEGAFGACTRLTSLIIPEGVTNIETLTFGDCSSLTSITIPDGVTSIGEHAFSRSGLTSINIPSGVRSIGFDAFGQCKNLASVTISENDTIIGDYAFRNCTSLTSVVIPAAVKSIGEDAFYGCSSLEYVDIKSTTPPSIGSYAFGYDDDYPIYVPAGYVDAYKSAQGWSEYTSRIEALPERQPNNEIWYTSTDQSVVSISYTKCFGANIVSNTYENGKGIIKFDGDVTMVGDESYSGTSTTPFYYEYKLETISLPQSVRKVGGCIFYGCSSLTSIQLPDSLDYLGVYFVDGSSIREIYIPKTVNFGYSSPCGTNNRSLERFTGPYASADGRCLIKDGVLLSFATANVTSYTIPEGVTKLVGSAFLGCKLEHIELPSTLDYIETQCFQSCSSLSEIVIPESVTYIGMYAFAGCKSLKTIHIPENANVEDYGPFEYCDSLTEFTGRYASADGRYLIKNNAIISFAPYGLKNIVIPDGVKRIKMNAFNSCNELTSVIIPESVEYIENYAFAYCDSLSITMLSSTPPDIDADILLGQVDNPIYVPAESVAAYKAAEKWSAYADRIQAIP